MSHTATKIYCLLLGILCAINVSPAQAQVSFTLLDDLSPGVGSARSDGIDVSHDGRVVVGLAAANGYIAQAFRWTAAEGMVGLGDLPGGSNWSQAHAVSADGSAVVGRGSPGNGEEAFRWTAPGTMIGLGGLPRPSTSVLSMALSVSADGSVVVGESASSNGFQAFRWTAAEGMVTLGNPPPGFESSRAYDVSADGSVIVGEIRMAQSPLRPFRWTAADGIQIITDPLGLIAPNSARGVSADGTIVVGNGLNEAFRWTTAGDIIGLGDLPGGEYRSVANDVSADGSVIVGNSYSSDGLEAFVWTEQTGMISLRQFLRTYGMITDLDGDLHALAVSGDGRTIVGTASNAAGEFRAFVATIPEPSTFLLIVLAAFVALCSCASTAFRRLPSGV